MGVAVEVVFPQVVKIAALEAVVLLAIRLLASEAR
jgi:hypothetical protein